MDVHLLPLTASYAYNERVAAFAETQRCIRAVHLSHLLCHHADDLLDDPARAEHNRQVAALYQSIGLETWAWTHEVHHPPAHLLDDQGRLRLDDPQLDRWLNEKYARFFEESLPGLTGLVLTFAETQFAVYQDQKVISRQPPRQRVMALIDRMRDICHRHGKRLAVRDFVYRLSEVRTMGETLQEIAPDVAVMSKIVPHDWHPYYPPNPLLGAVGRREQWVEHDLGHEYEGQHLYPFADLAVLRERLEAGARAGCRSICIRLDRYAGDTGQSALDTPWGRREVQCVLDFADSRPRAGQAEGEEQLLAGCTEVTKRMLFPAKMWLADHSRLPTYHYAVTHLTGGNADRLGIWTGEEVDLEIERAFAAMQPALLEQCREEMDQARGELAACQALITGSMGAGLGQGYTHGVAALEAWFDLWHAFREAFFPLRCLEDCGVGDAGQIARAIEQLERCCRDAAGWLSECWLEGEPAGFHRPRAHDRRAGAEPADEYPFAPAVASLRNRLEAWERSGCGPPEG